MTSTTPRTWPRVARVARRWKMTRKRPRAVIATITAETMTVNQAAAGMTSFLSCSAEEGADGPRVAHRARGDLPDGPVGRGQGFGGAVEFADEGDAAAENLVAGGPDPLQGGQHPVEQRDDHGKYHHQQYGVADPPQDHGSFPLARTGLV